jgi:hypothetical protein
MPVPFRAAALGHEAVDDPVEGQLAVIDSLASTNSL